MAKTKECPENPCVVMPTSVVIVSLVWLLLLIASFILFERLGTFSNFVEFDLGRLPFESIWFGAMGGWLISAQESSNTTANG
jgi:hypothetical protein